MYTKHFGFNEQPFGLTPNTLFYLNAQGHRQAFSMLQVALTNGEGFIKIVGEVGTGKTMLCRQLLNTLDEGYYTAYIPNPYLSPGALYRSVAEELGGRCRSRDGINEYQKHINERLVELVSEGKKVVLVIDEAQAMPLKTLEALRLISNLETETSKLIHIVLFGQPELDRLLGDVGLRQLRQRISFSYTLPPLDFDGTRHYIDHRISTAGYNGNPLFSNKAVDVIYRSSKGVPRLINILSHKALMSAYGKGLHQIQKIHALSAVKDTDSVEIPHLPTRWTWRLSLAAFAGCAGALYLLSGAMA
jgi:MSHA biogenesis protein MshM